MLTGIMLACIAQVSSGTGLLYTHGATSSFISTSGGDTSAAAAAAVAATSRPSPKGAGVVDGVGEAAQLPLDDLAPHTDDPHSDLALPAEAGGGGRVAGAAQMGGTPEGYEPLAGGAVHSVDGGGGGGASAEMVVNPLAVQPPLKGGF
jgi:hypothetical protein